MIFSYSYFFNCWVPFQDSRHSVIVLWLCLLTATGSSILAPLTPDVRSFDSLHGVLMVFFCSLATQVLQKLGKTVETKDEQFEQSAYHFQQQQVVSNRRVGLSFLAMWLAALWGWGGRGGKDMGDLLERRRSCL